MLRCGLKRTGLDKLLTTSSLSLSYSALACIFIRFKQVGIAAEGNNSVSLLNRVGFVLGIIACFGMSLVANFQVCVKPWYLANQIVVWVMKGFGFLSTK